MPPKATTKSITKCIKFGEILIDENRRLIFLCVQCSLDFTGLQEFREHLKNCNRVCHIFKAQASTKLNCEDGTKILKKIVKASSELIVYGFNEKNNENHEENNGDLTDLLKIEAELLDPRWYTDTAASNETDNKKQSSYNDLIEEVTPFVHFKENVKVNTTARVTRVSAKQATKEQQRKSEGAAIRNQENTVSPTMKLSLSEDKKQVLRQTVKQTPKSLEAVKKPAITQSPPEVINKPTVKTARKVAITVDTNKNEKQKIILSNTEKVSLKRKAESLPLPKEQKSDDNMLVKRRKVAAQQLRASLESNPLCMETPKTNVLQTKLTTSPIKAQNASTVCSLSQNTIILNKNDKRDSNANKPAQSKGRCEILSNKQLSPKSQAQPKITLRINTNHLQSTTSNTAIRGNNNNNKLQAKELPKAATKVNQSMPLAASSPIIIKKECQPLQEPTCPPANNQKTEEILNKLQTLGLRVQRTNPIQEPQNIPATKNSNEQAMEIIKKLQSKGMNVKIVQKPNTMPTKVPSNQPFTIINNPGSSIRADDGNAFNTVTPFSFPKRIATVTNNVLTSKSSFRKNVLIKKCN